MKTLYFISGLPRSGATMVSYLLRQNNQIHTEPVSSLGSLFSSVWSSWDNFESNKEYTNNEAKVGVLSGILESYYKHIDRPIVFDKDRTWVSKIGLLEAVTGKKVKILCMVRNPAEILASFERIRKHNPLEFTLPDQSLRESTTIAGRAYFYAGPSGNLGVAHSALKDAVTEGYLDRLLFVDYNRFCNSPRSQTKRIYDFFQLPEFQHDFSNIEQKDVFNDLATGLPGLHKVKPKVERTTVNVVEYLGLDLYEQYNREIFWDAWI
jgi:sulfotransferase